MTVIRLFPSFLLHHHHHQRSRCYLVFLYTPTISYSQHCSTNNSLPIKNPKSTQALVHQLLQTCTPSPREAKSYIRRYNLLLQKPPPYLQTLYNNNAIHIALIQLHWPISHPDSATVAKTLVALQRLTVVPVILLNLDPLHPHLLHPSSYTTTSHSIPSLALTDFTSFRNLYMQACHQVSRILDATGTVSRPLYTNVFHITSCTNHQSSTSSSTTTNRKNDLAVDVSPLQSCLEFGIIPILAPIATSWHTSTNVPLSIAHAMMALADCLTSNPKVSFLGPLGHDASHLNPTQQFIRRCVPTKLILINRSHGGIPVDVNYPDGSNLAIPGRAFINLAMEFDSIVNTLDEDAKDDLSQTHRVLSLMSTSATAMIVSASTSEAIVSHFLTDKPLVSVSLPQRPSPKSTPQPLLFQSPPPEKFKTTPYHDQTIVDQPPPPLPPPLPPPIPPTVCRLGVPIHILTEFSLLDQQKLTSLLESSFNRQLDTGPYYARLKTQMSTAIIAGDYVGAVIITLEDCHVPYLDKFAVSPTVQSGGVADILWMTLRTQVETLVWRSRHTNQVNPWYFARADGMVKLHSLRSHLYMGDWTVFWFSRVPWNAKSWNVPVDTYLKVANSIPASFLVKA